VGYSNIIMAFLNRCDGSEMKDNINATPELLDEGGVADVSDFEFRACGDICTGPRGQII
jgi:hypothetical protein